MNGLHIIDKPNLPENSVKLIAVGKEYTKRLSLSALGIDAICLDECINLERVVASHADMQVLHLYSNKFVTIPNIHCKVDKLYSEYLHGINCNTDSLYVEFRAGEPRRLEKYPYSASYNALIIDRYAVFNPLCIDPKAKALLENKYICLYVKQGYARCSTCIVNEDAVITSDPSIEAVLSEAGFDVLKICSGNISLPGYDYGFIGGASFKISKSKIAFTGTLDMHPDKSIILDFLSKHGAEAVYLSCEPIFDIGSAIPILESC